MLNQATAKHKDPSKEQTKIFQNILRAVMEDNDIT